MLSILASSRLFLLKLRRGIGGRLHALVVFARINRDYVVCTFDCLFTIFAMTNDLVSCLFGGVIHVSWMKTQPRGLAAIVLLTIMGKLFRFLEMELPSAPFLRGNVLDRLCEVPMVTVEVPSIVLTLSVGLILRLGQDHGTVLPRTLAVPLSVFDANLDDVGFVRSDIAFCDREATVSGFHLDAMICNPQADTEPERFG